MSLTLNLDIFFNASTELNDIALPEQINGLLGENYKTWFNNFVEHKGFKGRQQIDGEVDSRAILIGDVYVSRGAKVEPYAMIQGPCFLAPGSLVRHAAYIRGYVYAGEKSVIGHTTEVKDSFLFPEAKAAHFAYIGNSILGRQVNLGAGVKIANLKLKKNIVSVVDPISNKKIHTGLRKLGAIIGDNVQVGCNAVLSPGSLLLPSTGVFPGTHFHGTLTSGYYK